MAIEKTSIKDVIDKNYAEFDLGLLCEEEYKSLKHIDMVVYTILNNQHGLSVKTTLNGSKRFVDKNGYIFLTYLHKFYYIAYSQHLPLQLIQLLQAFLMNY